MKTLISHLLLVAVMTAVIMACGTAGAESDVPPEDAQALAGRNREFAVAIFHELRTEEGNLFFSPYSLSVTLAMTYAGARGETEREMGEVLRFAGFEDRVHPAFASLDARLYTINDRGNVEITTANAIWPAKGYPFLAEFLSLIEGSYGSSITPIDYAGAPEKARLQINKWAEDRTAGRIKDLIPSGVIRPLVKLVLTNAIYFKGSWMRPFDETSTAPELFHRAHREWVKVPMMKMESRFRYREGDTGKVLVLPYEGQDISMVLFLPSGPLSLEEMEAGLTAEGIGRAIMSTSYEVVDVWLPKFRIESLFTLNEPLKSMGMEMAFSTAAADFSGMAGARHPLFISAVLQKAFVEVNEEGTEAAAATAVVMETESVGGEPVEFHADRPFVFVIWENVNGSILFMGRVADPSE